MRLPTMGYLMKNRPNLLTVTSLMKSVAQNAQHTPDGKWLPARPVGAFGVVDRFRYAWLVFTGRADALLWPADWEPDPACKRGKPEALR